MASTLRQAAGSLLVVGLSGTELSGLERAWIRLVRPGGVILFRRNIADVRQTRALLDEATALCAEHSFRCVDVEGGTVDRLRDALAPMPSAQAVARAAARQGKPDLVRMHGEWIGRAVRAFGFNTTLAPVLDLALPESTAVMGTRAVSADAEGVIAYAGALLAGLRAQGVAGCGKHFPGLGAGMLDSHVETPQIERGWKDLWREDLAPYRALCAALPMVMVNHGAYPRTPGGRRPASVSPFWITTVLRKRIGYRGIVFSDDLEMGGILKYMPIEEAVVTAVRAGMDTMEICHSPELILRGYEALVREGERSVVFRKLLLHRASDVRRKRAKLFRKGVAPALREKQLAALREKILQFGEEVRQLADEARRSLPKPDKHVEAT
ncbi:MAG: beta-N-acetylhexosaminidase [Terracidiphilus sp.]